MRARRAFAITGITLAVVLAPAAAASAHPLGNFTVNHYDGLTVFSDHVTDSAVIDTAEIPTYQQRGSVDANHDGVASASERTSYATTRCLQLAVGLRAELGGTRLQWQVQHSSFVYVPGAAHLDTSRLECSLTATSTVKSATTLQFTDEFEADRIGWHEITAVARGVRLDNSPVPATSVSNELRHYPNDLLSSPLDVRTVTLHIDPRPGASSYASTHKLPAAGPFSTALSRLTDVFNRLVDAKHLSASVALLALLMSMLLGAAHAALPGHGKTVMAAYLAGREGRARDAVAVGATVTVTHTAGVLALGLLLTLSASLAGETVLGWLAAASGLLIAGVGIGLLRSALRERQHSHAHTHGHEHDHDHSHGISRRGLVGMGIAGGLVPSPSALVVLLGAVALGRTAFGIALVIGYGFGMAATLTAVGLVLVRLRDRLSSRLARLSRLTTAVPFVSAGVITTVGLGLALRGLAPLAI